MKGVSRDKIIKIAVEHHVNGLTHGEIGLKYKVTANQITKILSISFKDKTILNIVCHEIREKHK